MRIDSAKQKLKGRDLNPLTHPLIAVLAICGGYAFIFLFDYFNQDEHGMSLCYFKNITGIPCPGCGMGRATLALFRGEILTSLSYHLLCIPFTLAVVYSLFQLCKDLVKKENKFLKTLSGKLPPIYLILILSLIIISWIINIYRGL